MIALYFILSLINGSEKVVFYIDMLMREFDMTSPFYSFINDDIPKDLPLRVYLISFFFLAVLLLFVIISFPISLILNKFNLNVALSSYPELPDFFWGIKLIYYCVTAIYVAVYSIFVTIFSILSPS